MLERVCDTVYTVNFHAKDDFQCINIPNPVCTTEEKTVYEKTCRTETVFDCSNLEDAYGRRADSSVMESSDFSTSSGSGYSSGSGPSGSDYSSSGSSSQSGSYGSSASTASGYGASRLKNDELFSSL